VKASKSTKERALFYKRCFVALCGVIQELTQR